jgi:hypothetical protein
MRAVLQGQECPALVDPRALDALKDMLLEAAKYMDEIMGIDKSQPGSLLDKLMESISEGRVDWKRLLGDVEDALDI